MKTLSANKKKKRKKYPSTDKAVFSLHVYVKKILALYSAVTPVMTSQCAGVWLENHTLRTCCSC